MLRENLKKEYKSADLSDLLKLMNLNRKQSITDFIGGKSGIKLSYLYKMYDFYGIKLSYNDISLTLNSLITNLHKEISMSQNFWEKFKIASGTKKHKSEILSILKLENNRDMRFDDFDDLLIKIGVT